MDRFLGRVIDALKIAAPGNTLRISVSVSGFELGHPAFRSKLAMVLADTGVDPSILTLEITETVAGQLLESSADLFKSIAAEGIRLAMDDFRTESSGLQQMVSLPWNTIKLDRSLIAGLTSVDSPRSALLRAVNRLAAEIGADIVAEGVEDLATVGVVRELGCTHVQGWAFGKGRADLQGARLDISDFH